LRSFVVLYSLIYKSKIYKILKMKKYLPIFLSVLVVVILILGGFIYFNLRSRNEQSTSTDQETVKIVSLEDSPFSSLTPSSKGDCIPKSPDGTWLSLNLENIKFPAVEYVILYTPDTGIQQGVPSSLIDLKGQSELSRDILLGSESNHKCRYDKGVETGSLSLKFRSTDGKFLGKLETDWHLQTNTRKLSSIDGNFKFTLSKDAVGYFIVMKTLGLPSPAPGKVIGGPYGVFASKARNISGVVELQGEGTLYGWDGKMWNKIENGNVSNMQVFVKLAD